MLLCLGLCTGLLACAPKADPYAGLKAMEESFRALVWEKGDGPEVESMARTLRDALVAFASDNADHPEAPVFLHNAATIDADFLDDPSTAADLFGRVADHYPDHELAERCRFLQAYTFAEGAGDLEKARAAYTLFLQEYPDSELAESVRHEIDNLGKPLPELP